MPAPGDQYRGGNVVNPFEERVVNQFTAQEIATLQSRLNQRLGPEFLSSRPGNGGGKVAYIEGNKAIALANEVFGFNGWSSSLGQVQIDFVDEHQGGKVSLGLSIVVRITLKDGTFHEDIGYGSIENGKGKAASFEKAKKEAATDGLKRSLRTFGNVLGNCLYDKDYLKKVQAMKIKPAPFQEDTLYRSVHYRTSGQEEQTMIKGEPHMTPSRPNQILRTRTEHLTASMSADFDDEFDGNLFDGVEITGHEGEEFTFESASGSGEGASRAASPSKPAMAPNGASSTRPTPAANGGQARPPNSRMQTAPGRGQGGAQQHQSNQGPAKPLPNGPPNTKAPQTPVQQHNQPRPAQNGGRMPPPTADNQVASKPSNQQQQNPQQAPQNQPLRPTPPEAQRPVAQARPAPQAPTPQAQAPSAATANSAPAAGSNRAPVGFVTSRAAELMQNSDVAASLNNLPAFNPHAESPIPKEQRTPGVEHSRSAPVKWREVGAPPVPAAAAPPPPRPGGAAFSRPNFVNQNQDVNRRIGMPGTPGYAMSPTANRGAYKPPTFAGGAPPNALKRPALQDVSNTGTNGGTNGADSGDTKRQRVEAPGVENTGVVSS